MPEMQAFDANGAFFTQQMMNRGNSGSGGGGAPLDFPLLADTQTNIFDIKSNSIADKFMSLQEPIFRLNPTKSGGLVDKFIQAFQLNTLFGSYNFFQGNEGLPGASQDQHDYRGAKPIETPDMGPAQMSIG